MEIIIYTMTCQWHFSKNYDMTSNNKLVSLSYVWRPSIHGMVFPQHHVLLSFVLKEHLKKKLWQEGQPWWLLWAHYCSSVRHLLRCYTFTHTLHTAWRLGTFLLKLKIDTHSTNCSTFISSPIITNKKHFNMSCTSEEHYRALF